MSKYIPGHNLNKRFIEVDAMSERELLQILDSLFGRQNLVYGDTIHKVKKEVRAQLEKEWACSFWKNCVCTYPRGCPYK